MTSPRDDARGRLERAAVAAYTASPATATAARIAADAGLTERTFFRYFASKADAFFGDEDRLVALSVRAVADAPSGSGRLAAALHALGELAADFDAHRDDILRRAAVVAAVPELRDAEALRREAWVARLAEALIARDDAAHTDADADADGDAGRDARLAARLSAETALVVFRSAYLDWSSAARSPAGSSFAERMRRTAAILRAEVEAGIRSSDSD